MYDLLIQGGRVIDPSQGVEADRDVALAEGRVAAVAPHFSRFAIKRNWLSNGFSCDVRGLD